MRLVDAPARQYASAMHTNQHPAAIEFGVAGSTDPRAQPLQFMR